MNKQAQELVAVLEEAKQLLARPDNDFSWSYLGDAETAVAEVDGLIATIRDGGKPDVLALQVLFTVTGPIQEVSLSSGWADEFLDLAQRFDHAIAPYQRQPPPPFT